MFLPDPVLSIVLKPRFPTVRLHDLREDVTDQTTYTFTDVNLPDLGSTASFFDGNTPGINTAHVPSRGRKFISAIIHAKDDAATFNVSSCTLGGVAGTIRVQQGGSTNITVAIIQWTTASLTGMANRDLVVTFDEAVTGCAVGLISVDGVSMHFVGGSQSQSATGNMDGALTTVQVGPMLYMLGSTCITGGGTERFNATVMGTGGGNFEPVILYEASNAEFDYAACYSIHPSPLTERNSLRCTWSGTGSGAIAYTHIFV